MNLAEQPKGVFVYGTLMQGESHHHLLGPHVVALTPARSEGRMYATGQAFPAVFLGCDHAIEGEFAELSAVRERLDALDAYEGVDATNSSEGFYQRVVRPVTLVTGDVVSAYLYVMPAHRESTLIEQGAVLVEDGDWRAYRAKVAE